MEKKDLKIGDRVRACGWETYGLELTGIVTKIIEFDPSNPVEDHGGITIKLDEGCDYFKKVNYKLEHYAHYQWEKYLTIVDVEPDTIFGVLAHSERRDG